MSEKMRLRMEHTSNGTPLLYDQAGVLIASVWAGDRQAEYIVAAVNAYVADAVPPQRFGAPATVSESQWIPLPRRVLNRDHIVEWGWERDHVYYQTTKGCHDLNREYSMAFLRYMARAMGDAFPAALREVLA